MQGKGATQTLTCGLRETVLMDSLASAKLDFSGCGGWLPASCSH